MRFLVSNSPVRRPKGSLIGLLHEGVSTGLQGRPSRSSRTKANPARHDYRAELAGPGDNTKAVVFDFMKPLAAGGQLVGFGWETRRDEPGREGTLQHVN